MPRQPRLDAPGVLHHVMGRSIEGVNLFRTDRDRDDFLNRLGDLDIVFRHGPEKLKEFQGFHDEKLMGKSEGQRSSRLSLQYRVIYTVAQDIVTVLVLEITPHNY